MGIGYDLAMQAQERAKQKQAMEEAFNETNEAKGDHFEVETNELVEDLRERCWLDPLHWTQKERQRVKSQDEEVAEFLSVDNSVKTVDDYFK